VFRLVRAGAGVRGRKHDRRRRRCEHEAEVGDSARVDGAGELRIRWRIMIPLSKPAIATAPIVVVFLAAQKYFIRGMALTGIAGR
jgi:ABC-type glycerol-3-phosphate transport system permease component